MTTVTMMMTTVTLVMTTVKMMITTVTMMMTTVTEVMTTVMIGTENTQEKIFLVRAGRWHGWKLFSIYNWFKSAVLSMEKGNISLKIFLPLMKLTWKAEYVSHMQTDKRKSI